MKYRSRARRKALSKAQNLPRATSAALNPPRGLALPISRRRRRPLLKPRRTPVCAMVARTGPPWPHQPNLALSASNHASRNLASRGRTSSKAGLHNNTRTARVANPVESAVIAENAATMTVRSVIAASFVAITARHVLRRRICPLRARSTSPSCRPCRWPTSPRWLATSVSRTSAR